MPQFLTEDIPDNSTKVTAKIEGSAPGEVSYTITIPDKVDFGTLTQLESEVDSNKYVGFEVEAKELFGEDAEVILQSHSWPHWGNDIINEYMINTASVYKYIFAQTLMYINQGYTSTEIANMISLPEDLNKVWYTRQYYGTLKQQCKGSLSEIHGMV